MKHHNDQNTNRPSAPAIGLGLEELIRQGARQVIQQAIEAELSELLNHYANVTTLHGQRAVVRNGYLPEREVLTAIGPVPVKLPKVRDRSGQGVKFNSAIVPPYVRRSAKLSAALPWLYLKGISSGDHERGTLGPGGRGGQRLVGERGEPATRAMGRGTCRVEPALLERQALRVLVGGWHSHRSARRVIERRPMPAGHHRRDPGRPQGARGHR
jgi:hypothetical protein